MQVLMATPENICDTNWYPDSGASNHVTTNANNLVEHTPYHGNEQVHVGNSMRLFIKHIGLSQFSSHFTSQFLSLNHILHVPKITKNLLSVSKFARENNVLFEFHPNFCLIKDQVSEIVVMEGKLKDGLYAFDSSQIQLQKSAPSQVSLSQNVTSRQSSPSANCQVFVHVLDLKSQNGSSIVGLWHDRLGHP